MSGVYGYSTTAASNTSADGVSTAEGMNPALVNNAMRGIMAEIAKYRLDTSGSITSTGSANAQAIATNSTISAYADGQKFSFVAGYSNSGAATLNVDGVGAKAIRKDDDQALVGGEILAAGHYEVEYDASANSAAGAWLLKNPSFSDNLNVDNININGNTISSTDTNGDINLTPDGTGEVVVTNINADGGNIDDCAIGSNTLSTGKFTTVEIGSGAASAPASVLKVLVPSAGTGSIGSYAATTAAIGHARWANTNGTVGSITTSGTATAYNTSSDETWKSFKGEFDPKKAIEIIRADPVRVFDWIPEKGGGSAIGWGAQTSYSISTDLASPGGWFDEKTGEPCRKTAKNAVYVPWGVDQSKRTPYLWAALSWALDQIDSLEKRLSVLEAKQ